MKLTAANATVNAISVGSVTVGAATINSTVTVGNVVINADSIFVSDGVSRITPTAVSVPQLTLSGTPVLGSQLGAIVNTQIFTANGTWINPYKGLKYTYYTQSTAVVANTEADLDSYFDTATANPVVTFGGSGFHPTNINWGDSSQSGAGGTVGPKPPYLPANQYSVMYEGYILAPETGSYTFGVDGDDACDVFVNDTRVAHFYGGHGFAGVWSGNTTYPQQTTGTISLVANTYYSFKARMQDGGVQDGLQVGWQKPSDSSISVVPANAFFSGVGSKSELNGDEQVLVMAWGGGGGGTGNSGWISSGGGGACVIGHYELNELPSTVSVTVGSGGTGRLTSAGDAGGNTSFGSLIAYGGGGSSTSPAYPGGGGGGVLGAGNVVGGAPLGGAVPAGVSTLGGGGGANNNTVAGGPSVFGGGGGSSGTLAYSGNSIYGGGGGGSGTSVFAGSGGSSVGTSTARNGSIPAGGGGANSSGGGNGARGEVRVWVIGKTSRITGP